MNTIDILQYFTRDGRRRTLELNSTGIVAEKISRSGLTDDVLIFLQESSASRRGVSIDSRWVQSIGIVPHVDGKLGKVTIELHVDGPRIAFPQKGEPGAWKFTLEWVSNGDVIVDAFAWRISTYSIPWLKKQTSRSSAIGAWLKRETVLFKKETNELKLSGPLPVQALGWLDAKNTWGPRSCFIGLLGHYDDEASVGSLSIVCMVDPRLADGYGNGWDEVNLLPQHLQDLRPDGAKGESVVAALCAPLGLGARSQESPWYSVFQWQGMFGPGETPVAKTMERLANVASNNAMLGLRVASAGLPYWPAPQFSFSKKFKIVEARYQLWFQLPQRLNDSSVICAFDAEPVSFKGDDRIHGDLTWFQTETAAQGNRPSIRGREAPTLTLRGSWQSLETTLSPKLEDRLKTGAQIAKMATRIAAGFHDGVASWLIKDCKVEFNAGRWLRFGGFDIQPVERADALVKPAVRYWLRGEWRSRQLDREPKNAAVCDVYPEAELTGIPCRVRVSSLADRSDEQLTAQFDVLSGFEDALQRPSRPIVYSLDGVGAEAEMARDVSASLNIRVRAEPRRNAVVEMRLTRAESATGLKNTSFYLQSRPFTVLRLGETKFDEEGGLDIAVWRSDDPEGPQWRVPSDRIDLMFPAQGVAEEHERGNRFWKKTDESYIRTDKPVRYRFTPPTSLTILPGQRPRRYNRYNNNVGEALLHSRVQSFTTELLYPIAMRFERDGNDGPPIELAETSRFIGRPAIKLPLPPDTDDRVESQDLNYLLDVLPDDLARWFHGRQAQNQEERTQAQTRYRKLYESLKRVRWQQTANRAQFTARVGQFHLFDADLPGRQLKLSRQVTARIRTPEQLAQDELPREGSLPFPSHPLPNDVDLLASEKLKPAGGGASETWKFIKQRTPLTWAKVHDETPAPGEVDGDWTGAIRAGALHTMEFASELNAVLRNTVGTNVLIEQLALSAIGGTGVASASFDEGRTTFMVEIADGFVSRIRKTRIGRIALLWNVAKHVVIYERSVVPSAQFEKEQPAGTTIGWPLLRKTDEYVEPIETVHEFDREKDAAEGRPGFLVASEIVSERIYVNGAWGRDCRKSGPDGPGTGERHGYEIPLWNALDTTGFYPKPDIALRIAAGASETSRAWVKDSDELYFYSNTELGTGADPNLWEPQAGVDTVAAGPMRLPLLSRVDVNGVLDRARVPAPRLEGLRRPRFDLRVRTDGPVDLQHRRSEEIILCPGVDVLSIARAGDAPFKMEPDSDDPRLSKLQEDLKPATALAAHGAEVNALTEELDQFLREVPSLFLRLQFDCDRLKKEMERRHVALMTRLKEQARSVFDPDASAVFPLPDVNLLQRTLLDRLTNEWVALALPPAAIAGQYFVDFRRELERVQAEIERAVVDELEGLQEGLRASLASVEQLLQRLDTAVKGVRDRFADFNTQVQSLQSSVTLCTDALTALQSADEVGKVQAAAAQLRAAAVEARVALDRVTDPASIRALEPVRAALIAAEKLAVTAPETGNEWWTSFMAVNSSLWLATNGLNGLLNTATGSLRQASADLKALSVNLVDPLRTLVEEVSDSLETKWGDTSAGQQAVLEILSKLGPQVADQGDALSQKYHTFVKDAASAIEQALSPVVDAMRRQTRTVLYLEHSLQKAVLRINAYLTSQLEQWDKKGFPALLSRITSECQQGGAKLDEIRRDLETSIREIGQDLVERVTESLNSLIDDAARETFEKISKNVWNAAGTTSRGIQLVKSIGELPRMLELEANALIGEFLYGDARSAIAVSPFAARLREVEAGMKELAVAIPVNALLDKLVPAELENVDFNKVFRDMGGVDFRKLLRNARLSKYAGKGIELTNGVDPASRAIWVKSRIRFDEPSPKELFGISALSVQVAKMALRGRSDVEARLDGQRRAHTEASLRADWRLKFTGTSMVEFRDVAVRLENGRLDVDIAPEKIWLHPSLAFLSNVTKTLGENIPPCIEMVRDSRGAIVGARANFVTRIAEPKTVGAVTIGAMSLHSGFALELDKGAGFIIAANLRVGSSSSPVFVQIGALGGGLWLDALARFIDGDIVYVGNVGLALGAQQGFTLGGVARGSFKLLLFANGTFMSGRGGSLRAGLLIEGSARVLGMINAYLLLMMEMLHEANQSRGKGLLQVRVEVGRWYKVNVRKLVEKKL